jgi:hypothetical protein
MQFRLVFSNFDSCPQLAHTQASYKNITIFKQKKTAMNETQNSIQRDINGIGPSDNRLGITTEIYVYTLVSQLVCLIVIAIIVLIQKYTNVVL